jgi:hypothetical protein
MNSWKINGVEITKLICIFWYCLYICPLYLINLNKNEVHKTLVKHSHDAICK